MQLLGPFKPGRVPFGALAKIQTSFSQHLLPRAFVKKCWQYADQLKKDCIESRAQSASFLIVVRQCLELSASCLILSNVHLTIALVNVN